MLSDTLSSKSLTFTFKATELSLDVVVKALDKLLQEKTKEKRGKQSIKNLRRKGNLQVIDVTDDTLKKLNRYLKKFNIDYSILKDKTEEKQYTLFFRSYDAELLNKVMNNFLQDKFKKRESITEKIEKVKQKYIENTQDKRTKHIKKERKAKYEEL